MSRAPTALAVVVLAIACGCGPELRFESPPATSYTAETRQVKVGEAVTSMLVATVTLDFFRATKVLPLLGRFFVEGDDRSSAPRVVVLSHDLWTEHLASSPAIIGRNIELDGRPATVVGVASRGFRFPEGTLLWILKDRPAQVASAQKGEPSAPSDPCHMARVDTAASERVDAGPLRPSR